MDHDGQIGDFARLLEAVAARRSASSTSCRPPGPLADRRALILNSLREPVDAAPGPGRCRSLSRGSVRAVLAASRYGEMMGIDGKAVARLQRTGKRGQQRVRRLGHGPAQLADQVEVAHGRHVVDRRAVARGANG